MPANFTDTMPDNASAVAWARNPSTVSGGCIPRQICVRSEKNVKGIPERAVSRQAELALESGRQGTGKKAVLPELLLEVSRAKRGK